MESLPPVEPFGSMLTATTSTGEAIDWSDPKWRDHRNWEVSLEDNWTFIELYERMTGAVHPYRLSRILPSDVREQICRDIYKENVNPTRAVDSFFGKAYVLVSAVGMSILCVLPKLGYAISPLTTSLIGGTALISAHLVSRCAARSVWDRWLCDVVPINWDLVPAEEMYAREDAEHDRRFGPCPKFTAWLEQQSEWFRSLPQLPPEAHE